MGALIVLDRRSKSIDREKAHVFVENCPTTSVSFRLESIYLRIEPVNTTPMKTIRKFALLLLLGSVLTTQTGCFGTFALTRKAYEFHDGLTDSKFLKSLLFWIPGGLVYMATAFVDTVILNLIEFWSGTNPLSMLEGEHEMQLATLKGVDYRIEATKDTFTTTQLGGDQAGEVRVMKFDRTDMTWKYSDSKVCEQPVLGFLDEQGDELRMYTDFGTIDIAAADLKNESVLMAKLGECKGEAMASTN
ncbi:MAG: DUF3332 family protein [Flavobacteriales bacterium]